MFVGEQRIGREQRVARYVDNGRKVNHHLPVSQLDGLGEPVRRNFALQQDQRRLFDGGTVRAHERCVDQSVCAGDDQDGVFAVGGDGNHGEPGDVVDVLEVVEVHSSFAHERGRWRGVRVASDGADERHAPAKLGCRARLVRALATGGDATATAQQRLSGLGVPRHVHGQVSVDGADDNNVGCGCGVRCVARCGGTGCAVLAHRSSSYGRSVGVS